MALGNALKEVFNDAVDVSYVPEFAFEQTPEARAHEIEELQYNLATQEGGAVEAGLISSANESGTTSNLSEKEKEEKKKKEAAEDLLLTLLLSPAEQEIKDLLDDIKEDLNALEASRDRERRLKEYMENGDYAAMRRMFGDEYFMDKEELKEKTPEELMELGNQTLGVEGLAQETLYESIQNKIQEAADKIDTLGEDSKPEVIKALRNDLDALRERANTEGKDFNKAFFKAGEKDLQNKDLYEIGRGESKGSDQGMQEKALKLANEGTRQMAFAQAASGEQPNADQQPQSPATETVELSTPSTSISQDVYGF